MLSRHGGVQVSTEKPSTNELAALRDAKAKAVQLAHDAFVGVQNGVDFKPLIESALMQFYHRGALDALESTLKSMKAKP
jgi:hypothetical protein